MHQIQNLQNLKLHLLIQQFTIFNYYHFCCSQLHHQMRYHKNKLIKYSHVTW